jgi:hypothetical protein
MKNAKLFIILALVGLFVAIAGGALVTVGKTIGQFFFGRNFAEDQLKTYVARVLNQEVNGVTCQGIDTDNNGYVSCDYSTTSSPNQVRTIECAAWGLDGFLNRGCKARLPGLPPR